MYDRDIQQDGARYSIMGKHLMAHLEAKTAEFSEEASRARAPQKTVAPHKAEPKLTKANAALRPQVATPDAFLNSALKKAAFYADDNVLIFNMDVREAMAHLTRAGMIDLPVE